MIKVLIVDDEYLIRQLIRNSIEWPHLGFEIIGEAANGEEALEILALAIPQLMIVDINMPYMNGLELAKHVGERYPDVKIVILSGYEEFEYAKQAIKFGVFGYLLKPVNAKELTEIALKAKQGIESSSQQKEYVLSLEKEFAQNRNLAKENFLKGLLIDKPIIKKKLEGLAFYSVRVKRKQIRVAVIVIDKLYQLWSDQKERDLWRFAVSNVFLELLSRRTNAEAFLGKNNQIVCVFNDFDACIETVERVRAQVNVLLRRFTLTIGLSQCFADMEHIALAYKEADIAVTTKFHKGIDRLIQFETPQPDCSFHDDIRTIHLEEMLILLRSGDFEKINVRLQHLFESMRINGVSIYSIEIASIDCIKPVMVFLKEKGIRLEEIWGENYDYIVEIKAMETFEEIKNTVLQIYEKALIHTKITKSNTAELTRKTIDYIDTHYANEALSLSEIAGILFVSPSYLSTLFKKELSISLFDYLTDYRLKQAKQLFDTRRDLKIHEVAKQVGYIDPLYFSKVFKKWSGVSPAKYLEKKQ